MLRRNKRTSYYQYEIYLDFMEENPLMSANKLSRTLDGKKWKELSDQLNKCTSGPTLSPEEWRKRLNDWKNSTRSKYRRSVSSDDKNSFITPLEKRALQIFSLEPTYRELPARAGFQEVEEEHVEHEEQVEEEQETEDEQYQGLFPAHELGPPTIINAHNTGKRIRLEGSGEIIYEVTSLAAPIQSVINEPAISYGKQIEKQLKRISDINEASLHFKIARFKYNNPGFEYIPEL